MISFIKGTVEDISESSLIVETSGGVGYEIFMTGPQMARIQIGDSVRIHTYLQVKEAGIALFGFMTRQEIAMFRLLILVNGVGPKGAMGILSRFSPDDLRMAVLAEDVKTISQAPGIGKKTAQKLILELKDKVTGGFSSGDAPGSEAPVSRAPSLENGRLEAADALTALGYSAAEAYKAVQKVENIPDNDVEAILKAALKNL